MPFLHTDTHIHRHIDTHTQKGGWKQRDTKREKEREMGIWVKITKKQLDPLETLILFQGCNLRLGEMNGFFKVIFRRVERRDSNQAHSLSRTLLTGQEEKLEPKCL